MRLNEVLHNRPPGCESTARDEGGLHYIAVITTQFLKRAKIRLLL